jgi:phage-related protein
MIAGLKPVPVIFWSTENGNEPAREWLKELPKDDRKKIGEDLRTLQLGWPMGMPLCKSLKGGLWELRSTLASHRIARIILTFFAGALVLLHGFIKKERRIRKADLDLAHDRLKALRKDR